MSDSVMVRGRSLGRRRWVHRLFMLNDWQSFKPGDAVSMRNQRTASSLMGLQAAGTDFFENLGAANIKGKAKILYAIGLFQRGQRGRDTCQGRS